MVPPLGDWGPLSQRPLKVHGQDADQLVASSLSCHFPALFGHLRADEEKRWCNSGTGPQVGMGAEVFVFLLK